jgi:hypothetical protein
MKPFLVFSFLFIFTINSYCENIELIPLLEKINTTTNIDEKNKLLDELKIKLAQKNKKAREEADAIIEAKKKIPLKAYDESLYNEKDALK